MKMRSDEEILKKCDEIGEAAVEAGLKTGLFQDNPTPAHEWLIHRQRESEHQRMKREMRNTRWALYASWVLVGISLLAALWQKDDAREQREIMREQLEQQRKDSQAQRDDAKTLLSVQISVEMDKQFDSTEMRQARRRLAAQLLNKQEVTEARVIDFFDKLAMYTHQDLIDQDIVSQSYSYWLERYWPAIKISIEEFRKQENDAGFYQDVEELYVDMVADDTKEGLRVPSKNEIQRFLREEATLPL